MIKTFLNSEGHQNRITGSKVTAILPKGWILPIGGASAVEGLRSTVLPRLVFFNKSNAKLVSVSLLSSTKIQLNLKLVAPRSHFLNSKLLAR